MVILQIVILLILFFIPGYLVLGKKFQDEEKFGLALAFSILMYAGMAVFLHLFKIPIVWAITIFPLSFITLFFRRPTFNIPWKLSLIFGITLILETILCGVSKFPVAGDSFWHFLSAKSFLTNAWTTLPFTDGYWQGIDKAFYMQYRPPLFNLILGFVFSIFGVSFEIAKLVVVLSTSSILLPVYLIAKRLYDEKCAIYSSILLITINSYFFLFTFEVFVHALGTYLPLCFFYLYLKRDWNYVAVLAAIAYLTHPSSSILFLSLILFELIKNRRIIFEFMKKRNIRIKVQYLYPILIFILLISPWLIRNYLIFGNPLYTTSFVPFCNEYQSCLTLTPPTPQDYLNFKNFIQNKLGSIYLTFLPRPYSVTFSTWDIQALWDPVKLNSALAGFLTYPLLIVVIYFLIRRPTQMIPFLFYLGMIISFFVIGFRRGYTYSVSQVVLLGIWGINIVKNSRIFICLIAIILIGQGIVVVYERGKQKEIPDQEVYLWIKNNIPADEKIMSCDVLPIAYWTDRTLFMTPNVDMPVILNCLENWDVHYLIVGPTDLRLRDIDIKEVEKRYKFLTQIQETRIYKVR